MNSIDTFLAETRVRELAATPTGVELLAANTQLQDAIATYAHAGAIGYERLGEGRSGFVVGVGDVALKIATRVYAGGLIRQPSDLIAQFTFMTGLHHYAAHAPQAREQSLHIPEQYFALRTRRGYISAQQRIAGVETLETWSMRNTHVDADVKAAMFSSIGNRIYAGIGTGTRLAIGLTDTFKSEPHFVSQGNVLVPANTAHPHTEALYIIDQPGPESGRGPGPEAAARAAAIYLTENAGNGNRRSVLRHYKA